MIFKKFDINNVTLRESLYSFMYLMCDGQRSNFKKRRSKRTKLGFERPIREMCTISAFEKGPEKDVVVT